MRCMACSGWRLRTWTGRWATRSTPSSATSAAGSRADLTISSDRGGSLLCGYWHCLRAARFRLDREPILQMTVKITSMDVTSAYAVLHVCGPRSRALLRQIVDGDLSPEAFPFCPLPGNRRGRCACPRDTTVILWRARLGAARAVGVCSPRLRTLMRRRARARACRHRLPRARYAQDGEGLRGLGRRHLTGLLAPSRRSWALRLP